MVKTMHIRASIVVSMLLFVAPLSIADTYEGYKSEVEGVGLWMLQYSFTQAQRERLGTTDIVIRRHKFGDTPEYATYCDGKNKLFVYEMNSQGFPCKLDYWDERQAWGSEETWKSIDPADKEKLLRTIDLAKKDKNSQAAQSEYYVSLLGLKLAKPGMYTVSMKPLQRGDWTTVKPTPEDLKASKQIATEHRGKFASGPNTRSLLDVGNAEQMKGLHAEHAKYINTVKTLKLAKGDSAIILLPTLYYSDAPLNTVGEEGSLITTVVMYEKGKYRLIGHLVGCSLSIGPDIDQDGVPEVLVDNCFSAFTGSVRYVKLVPQLKDIIVYSHY